jgi:hypothetical protein
MVSSKIDCKIYELKDTREKVVMELLKEIPIIISIFQDMTLLLECAAKIHFIFNNQRLSLLKGKKKS